MSAIAATPGEGHGAGEATRLIIAASLGAAVIALIGNPAGPSSIRLNEHEATRRIAGHDVRTNLNSQLVRTAFSWDIRCVRCNVQ